jgi:hypothetical protein
MQKILSIFSHPMLKKLDSELAKIFTNVPHLPKKITDILVKIAPYLVLISGLFLVTGGLRSIFGFRNFSHVFSFLVNIPAIYFYIIGCLQIISGAISIAAYQPLKNKQTEGFMALLSLTVLELLMNAISVIFLGDGIFGLLLGLLISLYFLYELRPNFLPNQIIVKKTKKSKK